MKYNKENKGVSCIRDFYGEHFSSEVNTNYMLQIHGEVIAENEDLNELVDEITGYADQLNKWAMHFSRLKSYKNTKEKKNDK